MREEGGLLRKECRSGRREWHGLHAEFGCGSTIGHDGAKEIGGGKGMKIDESGIAVRTFGDRGNHLDAFQE